MKLQTVFAGGVAAAFLSVSVVTASAASLLNGDFEAVQIGPPFSSNNLANVPGWGHTGTLGEGPLWAVGYSDFLGSVTVAGHGNQFVTLGGGYGVQGSASWTNTITGLTPGNSYNLNFMIAYEGSNTLAFTPQQSMTVGFSTGSSTGPQIFTASGAGAVDYWRTWLPETLLFTATGTSATVFFSVTNLYNDMGLDNVSVTDATSVVPLPAALPLFATGLGALGLLGWRRKKAA